MEWQAVVNTPGVRQWGDEYVVYNPCSGDTHLLDYLAGQILIKLQQKPQDTTALMRLLLIDWQFDSEQEAAEQIDVIVADLCALALIERA